MGGTKRTQNVCKDCGYTWYPRGKNLSLQCPKCAGGNIAYASCLSSGCLQVFAVALAVLAVPVVIGGVIGGVRSLFSSKPIPSATPAPTPSSTPEASESGATNTAENARAATETNSALTAAEKRKADLATNALKFNEERAAAGDAIGQFRMGQRYLMGEGVQTNLVKARDMFEKAAAQGHEGAKAELEKLANPK
jgi:hypothetical protein